MLVPDQAGCWVTTEADMIVTLLINPPLINCPTNDHCNNNNLIRVEDLAEPTGNGSTYLVNLESFKATELYHCHK